MVTKTQLLLQRLDEIGTAVSKKAGALALIGLGSVGLELDRLDAFSDLDFFVIVKPGSKKEYLDDLSWLTAVSPTAYYFQNTADGFKLLYQDGVFCEFAVFEETEIKTAVFAPGRVVWKAQGVDDSIALPQQVNSPPQPQSTEWLIGEVLTNLYIGLLREQRGEKLSAMRFIQGHALDRVLELSTLAETAVEIYPDPFSRERRYEQRFPNMALALPDYLQGYAKNRESAFAILEFLDKHFEVNPNMKQAIAALCKVSANSNDTQ